MLAWAAAIAWAILILNLGGDGFSAQSTGGFLRPLLERLLPFLGDASLEWLLWGVRKLAHLVEYAVFALLCLRALAQHRLSRARQTAGAIALAAVVALVDEGRQAQTSARTGSIVDVGVDLVGAFAGLWVWRRWHGGLAWTPTQGLRSHD